MGLEIKLYVTNQRRWLAIALYLYGNSIYAIVYNMIIRPYKNYLGHSKILAYNWFNKKMTKLQIKVEYKFAIY